MSQRRFWPADTYTRLISAMRWGRPCSPSPSPKALPTRWWASPGPSARSMHTMIYSTGKLLFETTGQVRQRIKLLKTSLLIIKSEAEYQSYSGTDGRCVPGSTALTFGPLRAAKSSTTVTPPTRPALPPTAAVPSLAAPASASVAATAPLQKTVVQPVWLQLRRPPQRSPFHRQRQW